jgi:hypothetical protein
VPVTAGGFQVRVHIDGHLVFVNTANNAVPTAADLANLRGIESSQNVNVTDTDELYYVGHNDVITASNWNRNVFYSTTKPVGTNP